MSAPWILRGRRLVAAARGIGFHGPAILRAGGAVLVGAVRWEQLHAFCACRVNDNSRLRRT